MVYKVMMSTEQGSAPGTSVPLTVQDMQDTRDPEQSFTCTVLDLSNPKDLAMVKEAGYEIVDLSAPVSSRTSSYASSDTLSLDTDISDIIPEIAAAAAQSAATGSLIPIIKEELKYNIQRKRLNEGKGILQVDLDGKRESYKLTAEDEERRRRRRDRNKIAAQKCRMKRREKGDELEEETIVLEDQNDRLKDEIEKLQAERELLTNMLQTHDICPRTCNTRLSTCSDSTEDPASPPDPAYVQDNLDIQMELEIECPESPFDINLIAADHCGGGTVFVD